MKLYTEEQVKEAMETALIPPIYRQDLWGHLTPIKLPSDEEIDKESFIINPPKIQNDYGKDYDDNIQYRDEWVAGVKWVIEQIKQQDNEENN